MAVETARARINLAATLSEARFWNSNESGIRTRGDINVYNLCNRYIIYHTHIKKYIHRYYRIMLLKKKNIDVKIGSCFTPKNCQGQEASGGLDGCEEGSEHLEPRLVLG